MRKIISLGLILAICLGLAGCGNGSKYNLKDAKTCTIEGISFKYPKEWKASDTTKTQSSEIVSFFGYNGDGNGGCDFDVRVYHNDTKDKSLEYFKRQDLAQILDNITVAGQDCCHVKYGTVEFYFFDFPKGMVSFSTSDEDVLSILPEILKTVTISQSKYNLKDTETCNIEGISFQYPKEWEASDDNNSDLKMISFWQGDENGDGKKLLLYVTVSYDTTKESQMKYEKSISASTANTFKILDNIDVAGQVCYHIYKYYGESSIGYMENGHYYFFNSPKGMVKIFSGQEDVLQILPDILKTVTIEE